MIQYSKFKKSTQELSVATHTGFII